MHLSSHLFFQDSAPFLNSIDSQLGKERPIVIHAKSNVFYNDQVENDGHAMTVIARRLNNQTKQCEYFFRDSVGQNCSFYKTEYEWDEKSGGIWVQQSQIEKIIKETNYLVP